MSIVLTPYAQAGRVIQASLQKLLAEKPVLLLLSGGSATELYKQLSESLDLSFSPGRLQVSLVDERWDTNPKHADANDRAIKASGFINKLTELGAEYTPVLHGGSLEDDASTYNAHLTEWTKNHAVVVILGIGNDGHTAGILPSADADTFHSRFDGEALTVGYEAGDKFAGRITTTFPLLRQARAAFLLAGNEEKEPILKRLLDPSESSLQRFPAKIVFEMNDVTVLSTLSEEEML